MKSSNVRERLEAAERDALSVHATLSAENRGRATPEAPSHLRTEFQRDRDRILHTNSFRRLKHKTQVFVAPVGDHYVTRLTHTLEVAQIARTIARSLSLNEDLAEAIALGHDIGHTPFGHIGESVLDRLMPSGFHHSQHSVRIVEKLEKCGKGLNLTRDVVEGIRRHSKPRGRFLDPESVEGMSLEAQIVRVSDAVAYLAHDINDAVRAGVVSLDDMPRSAVEALGRRHSERVDTLVSDIVEASWPATGLESPQANAPGGRPYISMSNQIGKSMTQLRDWMFANVYLPISDTREGQAAAEIVELLYERFKARPEEIPDSFPRLAESPERLAADYVCSMSDHFALACAEGVRPGRFADAFRGRV